MPTQPSVVSLIAVALAAAHATMAGATENRVTVAAMAASRSDPRFGRPVVSGIQGTGFEQNIRLGPPGVVYTSVPGTLSSAHSWIWRSWDGGRTFKWVPAAAPLTGKLPTCVGGGDTELAVDQAGNLYFNDLTLANFTVARSDNGGVTFTPPSCFSTETTPNDRQWYATDGDPTNGGSLYLTYNIVGGDPSVCPEPGGAEAANNVLVLARSPAAGVGSTAGVLFAPSKLITAACDEAIMGNVEISPVTHRIFVIHDTAALDAIRIARCEAVSFLVDPTGLSCADLPVASFPGYKTGANFPTLAVDSAGNLFAVWQQAPVDVATGNVTGDTLLYWSSSRDEGTTWTPPVQIPTPGLHNNVFAWAAAGDAGRVNVAWYGTPAVDAPGGCMGPDGADGEWSVYMTQTLNGTEPVPTFTPPILASEGFVHRGTMFTLIGNQCATDRTSTGDFLQMRIGPRGEAHIAYSDARSIVGAFIGHATVVRQNGGNSVFASAPRVEWDPPLTGSAADAAGDARYEADGITGASQPNLDILSSSVARMGAGTLRVTMVVADLRSLAPDPSSGNADTVLVWSTQWVVSSSTDPDGGRRFHAYMESVNGGAPRFFDGQNAVAILGGGVMMTYPGDHRIAGSYTPTAPGTITIDVPIGNVTAPGAEGNRLFSVTASTMTLPEPADTVPSLGGVGGSLFNLIDVAPAYDAVLSPNTPPDAVADVAETEPGVAVTIDVLANDSDADGDPLTVVAVTQGDRGQVRNEGDRLTYVPDPASAGKDTFNYTIGDGRGGTDTASVTVRVRPSPRSSSSLQKQIVPSAVRSTGSASGAGRRDSP